jgi:hypothetical protein
MTADSPQTLSGQPFLSSPTSSPPAPPYIPEPSIPPIDTDNEIIVARLEDIKKFTHFTVFYILPVVVRDGFDDLVKHIQGAWNSINENIENSKTQVRSLSTSALSDVGMSGQQLREIKSPILTRLIQGAYKAYHRLPEGVRKVVKAVAKALGAINRFLGSLVKLVSTLEIVKEFKEQIENIL